MPRHQNRRERNTIHPHKHTHEDTAHQPSEYLGHIYVEGYLVPGHPSDHEACRFESLTLTTSSSSRARMRIARAFMQVHGNATQWPDGYPSMDVVRAAIERGHTYIAADDEGPVAVFSFVPGPDET